MDLNLILGAVGIVVSVAVAYHIAVRQGAFNLVRAQLRFGVVVDKHRSDSQPWAVFVGLKEAGAQIYVLDLPIALTVRGTALRNVWLQTAYPKGRHASDVISVSLKSSFSGESFRAVHLGPFTLAECSIPTVNQDAGFFVADLVAWLATDLQTTKLEKGEGERVNARIEEFHWAADRVTISMRAENHPAIDINTWLVAFTYKDRQYADGTVALISEALMRRDGIPVKSGAPGSRVMFWHKHVRKGVVILPNFTTLQGRVAIDHLADANREEWFVEFTPVRNRLSPRIVDQAPTIRHTTAEMNPGDSPRLNPQR